MHPLTGLIIPERRRVGGPFLDVIFKRVAVESQEISPAGNVLGFDIKTSRESHSL